MLPGMFASPQRSLIALEWLVIACAIVTELTQWIHMPNDLAVHSAGIAAALVFCATAFVTTPSRRAAVALTIGEAASLTALAFLCSIDTFIFMSVVFVVRVARRLPMPWAMCAVIFVAIEPCAPGASMQSMPNMSGMRHLDIPQSLLIGIVGMFGAIAVSALREMTAANQRLREAAGRVQLAATLAERTRIARDLHDAVGHQLATLNITLENAIAFASDSARAAQYVQSAKAQTSDTLATVRTTIDRLADDPFEHEALDALLGRLARDFTERTTVLVTADVSIPPCEPHVTTALFRVVQEALTNIVRHASATQARIQVTSNRAGIGLEVVDDGVGFIPENNRSGHGMRTMRERIEAIGGEFRIVSTPGSGCVVHADLPALPP